MNMNNRIMTNQFLLLALVLALTIVQPLPLRVFLVIVLAVIAVMFNLRGMEIPGLALAAGSLGILLSFYEPKFIVLVIYVLVIIGGGFSLFSVPDKRQEK